MMLPLTGQLSERATTITGQERQLQRVDANHERWKQRFTEAIHQKATEQNLCSQFDDFIAEWGLERRTSEHEVRVSITYTSTLTVSARDSDDAIEEVESELNWYSFSRVYVNSHALTDPQWDSSDFDVERA